MPSHLDKAPRTLRVVYRSCPLGASSTKTRPRWFTKDLALTSYLTAVDMATDRGIPVHTTWLNDGALSSGVLDLMGDTGRIVHAEHGTNRGSYRHAVALAASDPDVEDTDLIWFAEDDYLYHPDALLHLLDGAHRFPAVDYFSLYSPQDLVHPDRAQVRPGWVHGTATTSTFGVRAAALRRDRRLLRVLPFVGAAWDWASMHVVTGRRPYPDGRLPWEVDGLGVTRTVALQLAGHAANVLSRLRPARLFMASDPVMAWHMEGDAPARWETIAKATAARIWV